MCPASRLRLSITVATFTCPLTTWRHYCTANYCHTAAAADTKDANEKIPMDLLGGRVRERVCRQMRTYLFYDSTDVKPNSVDGHSAENDSHEDYARRSHTGNRFLDKRDVRKVQRPIPNKTADSIKIKCARLNGKRQNDMNE